MVMKMDLKWKLSNIFKEKNSSKKAFLATDKTGQEFPLIEKNAWGLLQYNI